MPSTHITDKITTRTMDTFNNDTVREWTRLPTISPPSTSGDIIMMDSTNNNKVEGCTTSANLQLHKKRPAVCFPCTTPAKRRICSHTESPPSPREMPCSAEHEARSELMGILATAQARRALPMATTDMAPVLPPLAIQTRSLCGVRRLSLSTGNSQSPSNSGENAASPHWLSPAASSPIVRTANNPLDSHSGVPHGIGEHIHIQQGRRLSATVVSGNVGHAVHWPLGSASVSRIVAGPLSASPRLQWRQ